MRTKTADGGRAANRTISLRGGTEVMATIVGSVGRGGMNRPTDVQTVQNLINKNVGRMPPLAPLRVDGIAGPRTILAIEEFQRRVLGMHRPDGLVEPGGRTLRALSGDTTAPAVHTVDEPWIVIARQEIGTKEAPGLDKNHPRILEYISTFSYLRDVLRDDKKARLSEVDETPWCACFVNWCLIKAGKKAGPSARAKDWLSYGQRLEHPRAGAITVVYHAPGASTAGTTSSGYHVAFCTGGDGMASITLLGGNQSDQVSEKTYRGYWTVQGYRWPA